MRGKYISTTLAFCTRCGVIPPDNVLNAVLIAEFSLTESAIFVPMSPTVAFICPVAVLAVVAPEPEAGAADTSLPIPAFP